MSGYFGNFTDDPRIQRVALQNKYSAARINLLLMVVFSAINVVLLATGTGLYFMFSASIPYFITDIGMFVCGMYPDEYYGEALSKLTFIDKPYFYVMLAIALLVLAFYLVAWYFSKNNKVVWLKFAFGFFAFDTLILLLGYGAGAFITNLLFHIWLLVMLYLGISSHTKLMKMPKETEYIEGEFTDISDMQEDDYPEDMIAASAESDTAETDENQAHKQDTVYDIEDGQIFDSRDKDIE